MKVFISSLIAGFEPFREAVRSAVTTLRHEPVMAEDFGACPSSPHVACLSGLRDADAVVLVLGERYGAVQPVGPIGNPRRISRGAGPKAGYRLRAGRDQPRASAGGAPRSRPGRMACFEEDSGTQRISEPALRGRFTIMIWRAPSDP
jgi:hypothetical protein